MKIIIKSCVKNDNLTLLDIEFYQSSVHRFLKFLNAFTYFSINNSLEKINHDRFETQFNK